MDEEWRKIPFLPDRFEVSNLGRVRSISYTDPRGHIREERVYSCKDARVGLYFGGRQVEFSVAALVLYAFVGPPPGEYGRGLYIARHLDDDRSNNSIGNLAWGTPKDNSSDAIRNCRWPENSHSKAGKVGGRRTAELGFGFKLFTEQQRKEYARIGNLASSEAAKLRRMAAVK
jgi:hypothetical protein